MRGRPALYGPNGHTERAQLSTSLPAEVDALLHAACQESGMSITEWVRRAIQEKILRDYAYLLSEGQADGN